MCMWWQKDGYFFTDKSESFIFLIEENNFVIKLEENWICVKRVLFILICIIWSVQ